MTGGSIGLYDFCSKLVVIVILLTAMSCANII